MKARKPPILGSGVYSIRVKLLSKVFSLFLISYRLGLYPCNFRGKTVRFVSVSAYSTINRLMLTFIRMPTANMTLATEDPP